jgi:hypothetical protein
MFTGTRVNRREGTLLLATYGVYMTLEFNSLEAQREAAQAFIASQAQEDWICLPTATTTAASPAPTWNGRHCAASWPTSKPDRSIVS